MQFKIIAGLAAIIVGLVIFQLVDSNIEKKEKIASLEADIKTAFDKEAEYVKRAASAQVRETQYQAKIGEINADLKKLSDCVADNTCGVRIKTIRVYDTRASVSEPVEETARHCEISGQWYRGLLKIARENAAQLEALQVELLRRSAPDYCELKIN